LHQLGILDAIGPHQLLEANAVAFGDLGEGLAGLHHHRAGFGATVRAAVGSAAAAPARWGRCTARQHQALAGLHQLGILDAIGPHQLLEANAIALGDLGKGLAGLHHQIGKARQGEGHRQNQGGKGAAHGSTSNQRLRLRCL
jgi:hypothetical protein